MDDTVTITATALRLLVRAGFEVLAAQEAESRGPGGRGG